MEVPEREKAHKRRRRKSSKKKIQKNFPKLKGMSFRLRGSTTYLENRIKRESHKGSLRTKRRF